MRADSHEPDINSRPTGGRGRTQCAPRPDRRDLAAWREAVAKAKLTKLRACHFLAEIMTETGGLQAPSRERGAYAADRDDVGTGA